MVGTRIYRSITRMPLISTPILIWLNWEVWRIHRGTHPYFSPKIDAITEDLKQKYPKPENATAKRKKTEETSEETKPNTSSPQSSKGESPPGFISLNGIPIPNLHYIAHFFRKD